MATVKKHFVYYEDDYPDNGGIGFEECDSERKALKFIENRIIADPTHRSLDKYILVEGSKKEMKAIESVTRIKVV